MISEELAYSVRADFGATGNSGKISCKILTTTDNKETGELTYENVVKSIGGFSNQISALLNSKYTDDDLESAKRALKADLLINEGQYRKFSTIYSNVRTKQGVNYDNEVYELIDKITREDIQKYALHMFGNKPIYSIVASKDTLNANNEFFEGLKNI